VAKVVVIAGYGPSLVGFRGPLIRAMVTQGHDVVALAPEAEPPAGFLELGASYEQCALERTGMRPDRDVRMLGRLVRQLRRLAPEVVFAYTMKPVAYGMLAAWMAGVPRRYGLFTGLGYLFIGDGSSRQRLVHAMAVPLLRAGTSRATAIFVQNPDDARDLRAAHVIGRRQRVVRFWGSGVDLGEYPEQPLPEGPVCFLFLGRLLRDKGVREFVEAARLVRASYPESRFVVVGPTDPNPAGVPDDEIERWRQEGLVSVVGGVDDVRPFLRDCHVFVLPSYREGTPRSVLEAMSTGRAIVTTDAPGCRETVVDGLNGHLVPVKDAVSLARAMEQLADDPDWRSSAASASRELVERRFEVQKVVSEMMHAMELA